MTPAPDPKGPGRQATPSNPAEASSAAQGSTASSAATSSAQQRQVNAQGTDLRQVPQVEVSFSETELATVPAGSPASEPAPTRPDLGRTTAAVATPTTPSPAQPRQRERSQPQPSTDRAGLLMTLRLVGGVLTLGILAYLMWTPGEWTTALMGWVLLVILADEFGGWFGYLGLLLGGLGYFSPHPPPEQWLVILPLVGGCLMALLLVKHSGGILVLPFAGLLFAGVLLAVGRFGLKFDPELKLPSNETFLRSAVLAMLIGLGISFLRQLTGMFLRRRARLQARQKAAERSPSPA